MNEHVYTQIDTWHIDLFLRREFPANLWPGGEVSQWWRFSFPLRCAGEVNALAGECRLVNERDALELVRRKRREIQWGP